MFSQIYHLSIKLIFWAKGLFYLFNSQSFIAIYKYSARLNQMICSMLHVTVGLSDSQDPVSDKKVQIIWKDCLCDSKVTICWSSIFCQIGRNKYPPDWDHRDLNNGIILFFQEKNYYIHVPLLYNIYLPHLTSF